MLLYGRGKKVKSDSHQLCPTFPSSGYLSDTGIKPMSPALQVDSLPLSHQGPESLFSLDNYASDSPKYIITFPLAFHVLLRC